MKRQTGTGINEQLEVTGSGGSGDATAANQVIGNASLASIDGKVSTEATLALIKAKTDNIDVALSTRTKPADQQHVIIDSGAVTTGGLTDTQLRATPVPISGTVAVSTALNLEATQQQVKTDLDTINTTTAAANVLIGSVTETAPTTDTASSGLNGRLQRIAQRLTTALTGIVLAAGTNLIGYIGRKFTYGSIVTLTTTNFSGLTNTSGWQSVSIATGGASEIQFLLQTLGAAGSTALVDFYLAEAFTSGNFTDSATGTEGTFTAANRKNSRYIGSIQCNTTSSVIGMIKYTDVSGTLPERVALIGINNSGGTISATGGNTVFGYELIN